MTCQLWVKGDAENGGHFAVDTLWRDGWNPNDPLPTVSIISTPAAYSIYSDGLGGNFSGTGWYSAPIYYRQGCNAGVNPAQNFDCINGGCIPSAVYGTQGKYANLAACESGCGKDSPCTGECISADEIAALKQAVSNIKSKLCS